MGFFNLTALVLSAGMSRAKVEAEGDALSDERAAKPARRFESVPSKASADREAWLLSWTIRPF